MTLEDLAMPTRRRFIGWTAALVGCSLFARPGFAVPNHALSHLTLGCTYNRSPLKYRAVFTMGGDLYVKMLLPDADVRYSIQFPDGASVLRVEPVERPKAGEIVVEMPPELQQRLTVLSITDN